MGVEVEGRRGLVSRGWGGAVEASRSSADTVSLRAAFG